MVFSHRMAVASGNRAPKVVRTPFEKEVERRLQK